MFHEGDIQSGIALALQQSKAVLCFVHNEDENSQAWKNEILLDEEIAQVIQSSTVALQIASGSQEAGLLSPFCTIVAIPSVLIIQNGVMKGLIPHTPTTKDHLKQSILAHLGSSQAASNTGASETYGSIISTHVASPVAPATSSSSTSEASQPEALDASSPVPSPPVATPGTPSNGVPVRENPHNLADRANENRSITDESLDPGSSIESNALTNSASDTAEAQQPTPQQTWTKVQREREKRQREEQERIRAQIKHDHSERRRLDELRRQPAIDLTSRNASSSVKSHQRRPDSSDIRIQVRTCEGSTIRSTFSKNATMSAQIRPWLDTSAPQRTPYNLKIILTPLPNRTIETAEEDKPLQDLDIVGSCTLVMVPIKGFVESYAPAGSGILGSAISGGYSLLSGSVSALYGGARSVLGFGQVTNQVTAVTSAPEEVPSKLATGQVRVRTLADQRIEAQKKDQQFYNGNQLNFQPRVDDDSDDRD